MRVLILAYDGLEHNLVQEWSLEGLKQERYGKYKAIVSPKYGKPHTPSAWTTIITGRTPDEHGIDDWYTYGKIGDFIRSKPPFKWIKGKRRIASMLGLKVNRRIQDKSRLKASTIFDLAEKPVPLFIPGYNEPVEPHERLDKALEKGVNEYISTIWSIHKWRKKVFLEHLQGEWDLLMSWFDLSDLLGHVCWYKCRNQLLRGYIELDDLTRMVRSKVRPDTIIIVLSDHGMQGTDDMVTGDHSDHGFWSINRDIEWFNPTTALDFYPLIKRLLSE